MSMSKMMNKVALLLVLLAKVAQSQDTTSFTFNYFVPNPTDLTYQGDADVPSGSGDLRLTRTNTAGNPLSGSVGRVLYSRPVQFWDAQRQATFETTIEFNITATDNDPADGITFFIAPVNSAIPAGSSGGNLGIFGPSGTGTSIFAVEFDTYVNGAWDPPYRHMGVDVNSRNSVNTTRFDSLGIVSARINYNSNTRTVTVTARSNASGNVTLSSVVNLKSVLPQQVQVGLSASTGVQVSLHNIRSWYFSSTLVWDAPNQLDQDRTYLRLN